MGVTLRSARKLMSYSLCAVTLYYAVQKTVILGQSTSAQGDLSPSPVWQKSAYCSEAEYLDGTWEKRDVELRTFDEVRAAYNLSDLTELKCQAIDDSSHRDPTDPGYTARVLDVAQYEWKPSSGCEKRVFDRWAFAKRCLRSTAGLTFVGDSLTEHSYAVVAGLMVGSDGLFLSDGTPDNIFRIYLNLDHPKAASLLEQAGLVPESGSSYPPARAKMPLVNFYRDHHVFSREELDTAFEGVNGYLAFPSRSEEQNRIKWVAEKTNWWDGWREKLQAGVQLAGFTRSKSEIKKEKSVIVFNVGPHWSRGEITPEGYDLGTDAVANGYTKLVSDVLDKLNTLPRGDVLAFWRAVSPGDPECSQYPYPLNSRTSHLSVQNPSAWQFNWNLYPEMNIQSASRLSYRPSTDRRSLRTTPHSMRYFDVWPMSVTRPDAHLKPAIDCMHYCIPGVPNEWVAYLWHLMVLDSVNDDYV